MLPSWQQRKEIMKIEELKEFIKDKMRLSHLYQPLLIKELIENGGKATIRQLAISFLKNDESQISYFEKRIKDMPLKILAKHGIITRHDDLVELNVDKISFENKCEINKLCDDKIFEFVSQKGMGVWDYRFLDNENIPDSLRYLVLKESNGRCALCGITKEERPLDVDHIIPRSKGGKTVYENLQVLCSKCNRSKNNKDDQDFRKTNRNKFDDNCIFCRCSENKVLIENDFAYAIEDSFPVTKHHSLIIPRRHFDDVFELSGNELSAIYDLIKVRKNEIKKIDPDVTGFNIGVNSGSSAGQTIFHCHFHLIPRRNGDIENPKGGVRGVIPHRMHYS